MSIGNVFPIRIMNLSQECPEVLQRDNLYEKVDMLPILSHSGGRAATVLWLGTTAIAVEDLYVAGDITIVVAVEGCFVV